MFGGIDYLRYICMFVDLSMDYTQNQNTSWFVRFTHWREQHISAKNFTLILAVLVGLCSAFAALVLKTLIHSIQHFLLLNHKYHYLHCDKV
jgi:hypothetical protein